MANPQIENGHIKIANDIWDALARIRLSGQEWQVLNVILRKTYGFNKKEDRISLSQFALATGMKKPNIIRARDKLLSKQITIIKKDNAGNVSYRFNKNFDEWEPLSKQITVIYSDNASLSKQIPTKDNTTKDIILHSSESTKKPSVTPYQNMVEIYHEVLPELPAVRKLTDKRKLQAKKIWRDEEMAQDLNRWRSYCQHIRGSKFLMGLNGKKWQADFEWITNYNNYVKIIEGKYHK